MEATLKRRQHFQTYAEKLSNTTAEINTHAGTQKVKKWQDVIHYRLLVIVECCHGVLR